MVQSGVPVEPRNGGLTRGTSSRGLVVGAGTGEGERDPSEGGVGGADPKGLESVGTLLEECLRLGGRGMGSPMGSVFLGGSRGGSAGGVSKERFRSYFIVTVGGLIVSHMQSGF